MRVWICDDDINMVTELKRSCESYYTMQNISAEVIGMTYFPMDLELWRGLGETEIRGKLPEVLLLDIDMPGWNGLDVKNELEQLENGPFIIFVTSHYEEIHEAFGKNVIGFLVKPISNPRFLKLMDKACEYCRGSQQVVTEEGRRIPCRDIQYIYMKQGYKEIVLKTGDEIETRRSISEWETLLPKNDFFRIDKSHLIHFAYVKSIGGDQVLLNDGAVLTVSRRRKKECIAAFIAYSRRKARYK